MSLSSSPTLNALPALWNDGRTAVAHKAWLRVSPAGDMLEVHAEEPGLLLAIWPLQDISIGEGNKGDNVYKTILRLGTGPDNGERLTLLTPMATATFTTWCAGTKGHKRSPHKKRWLLGTAAIWGIALLFYFASPFIFRLAANLVPLSMEASMGEAVLKSITDNLTLLPKTRGIVDDPRMGHLAPLLARLETAGATQGYTFTLTVLDADFVNAFALPGGNIVLTTALIRECPSPDELAGVLAHEMTHVIERHGTSRLLRVYVWSHLARLAGASDSVAGTLGNMAVMLVSSGFDRDEERVADEQGAKRLVVAGINPEGLIQFFARLEKDQEGTKEILLAYIASHPGLGERQQALANFLSSQAGQNFTPAMSTAVWEELKAACAPKTAAAPAQKDG